MSPPRLLSAWMLTLIVGWPALACDEERGARCARSEDCPPGHRCGTDQRCSPRQPGVAGRPCETAEDCQAGLLCAKDGSCRTHDVDWCRPSADCGKRSECPTQGCWRIPSSDADCHGTEDCQLHGRCRLKGGRCVAGADADCRSSLLCRDAGRCSARDGRCVAASDADCESSAGCRTEGRCHADQGECIAASDEACGRSPACRQQGRCHWVDGACRVKTDQDCRQSELCSQCGLCRVKGRSCVARSNADCRASHQCWNFGQCARSQDRCVARSDADCAAAWECKIWGHCAVEGDVCVVDAEGCRRSHRCATEGMCTARGDACVAGSPQDGASPEAGRRDAECTADGEGHCAESADAGSVQADASRAVDASRAPAGEAQAAHPSTCLYASCVEEGRCTWQAGECVAATDRDCRQGRLCHRDGKCVARDGRCVKGLPSAAQCRAASECAVLGRCGAQGPHCVVESDADCRASALCREGGRCRALHRGTAFGRCVAAEAEDAGAPVIGDGTVPPFGHRSYRCEEPFPVPPLAGVELTRAADVRAERLGGEILIEPLGLRMRVPSHWQPQTATAPWVVVSPADLARATPRLRHYASDPVYPISALLLEAQLPGDALIALLAPEAYEVGPGSDGVTERGFWGAIAMVFAVQEPAAEVAAVLEPAVGVHAHAVSCPRDREARYSPYRKSATREWIDWDPSKPWSRWRDVRGPWLHLGAEAGWYAHGHHRSNRVEMHIRRFDPVTLVIVISSQDEPKIPVDPDAILPVVHRRDAGGRAPGAAPESRCLLPPKGHIHWALRPGAP